MKNPCNSACDWIALACAGGAMLLSLVNLAFWHLDPRFLLDASTSLSTTVPLMAPNSSIAIGATSIALVFLCRLQSGRWMGALPWILGVFLFLLGAASLVERLFDHPVWINHAYSNLFLGNRWVLTFFMDTPSPYTGSMMILLAAAFLSWRHAYRFAQVCLFGNLALASAVMLGHFYDAEGPAHLPFAAPLSGVSVFAAAGIALLSCGMLFCRAQESVVRLAFTRDPAGTVVTRFGLGALVTLAGFGATALLQDLLDTSYLPILKTAVSAALGLGLLALVWSTVRALERLERERLRAVGDLERNREQLLFAQRLAKVAYWQWNLLTDEIAASEDYLRLLGIPCLPKPPAFTDFLRAVHPEDRRRVTEAAYGSIAGRSFFSVDFRAVRPDGEAIYIHTQADVELDEHGQPWRMRGASLDVTELKRAEVAARQAEERVRILLDKANEAVRVREDVLSIVSHDLKNPLTSASLGVQLLLRQIAPLAEKASLLRTAGNIQRSVENMKLLIQGILDIGKIQSGTFSIEPCPVLPGDVLQATQEMLAPIARERSVDLRFAEPPSQPMLGDRTRLLQVLSNLVGNALKFTPSGGHVTVSCERDAGRVVFLVEDDGPGIPLEHQRHLFERNWQAPSTAAAGNGLGLFIAKGIVEAHQGHIWVDSEPGHGCRFRFTVPEAPPLSLERVLDRKTGDGVEATHVDVGRGAGVHVPEAVAVASLKLQRDVLREVDVYPQTGDTR